MKVIKGVEEAFLCPFLATKKVDIINQEHINATIFTAEFLCVSGADSVYKFVGKLFAADIDYLAVIGLGYMAYGV